LLLKQEYATIYIVKSKKLYTMSQEDRIPQRNPEFDKQPGVWGSVTDPSLHQDGQFRYLVHAFNPMAKTTMMMANLMMEQSGGYEDKGLHGDQSVDLFAHPERVADRVSLSMSLVDQDHTGTWGRAGMIVEAPEDNILITSSADVGSNNSSVAFLRKQAADGYLLSPDQLLAQTYPSSYNEVVGLANTEEGKLELKGFFYKVKSNGKPVEAYSANQVQNHARRLGLPVVAIREISHCPEDKVYERDGTMNAVSIGGRYFTLKGFNGFGESKDEWNYRVSDGDSIEFMSPDDVETVIEFLGGKGNDDSILDSVRTDYQEADRMRQTAKIEFDEHGKVKQVKCRFVYGEQECEERIGTSGHGYHVNLAQEYERNTESMLGNGMMRMDDWREPRTLAPERIRQLTEEAMLDLDPLKAADVRKWLADIMPTAEKAWEFELQKRRSQYGNDIGGLSTGSYFIDSKWGDEKLDIDLSAIYKDKK
jgi:hypothetical protein